MSQNIPESYRLNRIAEIVARKMDVDLAEPQERYRTLHDVVMSFENPTKHLIQFALMRGEVYSVINLEGKQAKALVHYSGAISKSTGKPVEMVYASNSRKVIAVTWDCPKDVGVLEVLDVKGSIALQELSGFTIGRGGIPKVPFNTMAPTPQPYVGIAQFRDGDFGKLQQTIDTLLD